MGAASELDVLIAPAWSSTGFKDLVRLTNAAFQKGWSRLGVGKPWLGPSALNVLSHVGFTDSSGRALTLDAHQWNAQRLADDLRMLNSDDRVVEFIIGDTMSHIDDTRLLIVSNAQRLQDSYDAASRIRIPQIKPLVDNFRRAKEDDLVQQTVQAAKKYDTHMSEATAKIKKSHNNISILGERLKAAPKTWQEAQRIARNYPGFVSISYGKGNDGWRIIRNESGFIEVPPGAPGTIKK